MVPHFEIVTNIISHTALALVSCSRLFCAFYSQRCQGYKLFCSFYYFQMSHGLPAGMAQLPGLPGLPPGVGGAPGAAGLASLAASSGLMPPTSAAGLLALSSLGGLPHLPPGLKDLDIKEHDKLVSSTVIAGLMKAKTICLSTRLAVFDKSSHYSLLIKQWGKVALYRTFLQTTKLAAWY